jgi:hypothetical protein
VDGNNNLSTEEKLVLLTEGLLSLPIEFEKLRYEYWTKVFGEHRIVIVQNLDCF